MSTVAITGVWGMRVVDSKYYRDRGAEKRDGGTERETVELRSGREEVRLKRETNGVRREAEELREGTEELRRETEELRKGTEELRRETNELRRNTEESRRGTQELKARQKNWEEVHRDREEKIYRGTEKRDSGTVKIDLEIERCWQAAGAGKQHKTPWQYDTNIVTNIVTNWHKLCDKHSDNLTQTLWQTFATNIATILHKHSHIKGDRGTVREKGQIRMGEMGPVAWLGELCPFSIMSVMSDAANARPRHLPCREIVWNAALKQVNEHEMDCVSWQLVIDIFSLLYCLLSLRVGSLPTFCIAA